MKDALYTIITDLDDYEFYKVDRELIKKFAYSKDWKKAGNFMPYQFAVVASDNYYLYKPDLITYDESTDTFSPSIENKKLKFGITETGQYFKSIVDLNMGAYMCPTVCRTFKDVDEIKDFCKTYNGTFINGYSESEVKRVRLTAELKKLKEQVEDVENKLKDLRDGAISSRGYGELDYNKVISGLSKSQRDSINNLLIEFRNTNSK